MQELEKRYEIARLIACELIGVLSGREAEDLEVWKNSSEKHAREYMEIRERLLRDIDYPDYLELKQEWEGFEQKLFRKKRVFNWWVTVAAACVVICLGITFLWMREPVAEPVVAGTSGGTKGFRATLILGNGEQVSIGDSSSQTIAVAGGTTIVTTGRMEYDCCTAWRRIRISFGRRNAGVVEFGVSPDLSRPFYGGAAGGENGGRNLFRCSPEGGTAFCRENG